MKTIGHRGHRENRALFVQNEKGVVLVDWGFPVGGEKQATRLREEASPRQAEWARAGARF